MVRGGGGLSGVPAAASTGCPPAACTHHRRPGTGPPSGTPFETPGTRSPAGHPRPASRQTHHHKQASVRRMLHARCVSSRGRGNTSTAPSFTCKCFHMRPHAAQHAKPHTRKHTQPATHARPKPVAAAHARPSSGCQAWAVRTLSTVSSASSSHAFSTEVLAWVGMAMRTTEPGTTHKTGASTL